MKRQWLFINSHSPNLLEAFLFQKILKNEHYSQEKLQNLISYSLIPEQPQLLLNTDCMLPTAILTYAIFVSDPQSHHFQEVFMFPKILKMSIWTKTHQTNSFAHSLILELPQPLLSNDHKLPKVEQALNHVSSWITLSGHPENLP